MGLFGRRARARQRACLASGLVVRHHVREQRRRYPFFASARHRQPLLSSDTPINQRLQQREITGQVFEDALEIPFQPRGTRPRFCIAHIAPGGELAGNHFLYCFAIGQVRRTARAGSDEVVLAQREAGRQIGDLDQSADVRARRRRNREPIPPALDDLAEGADCDAFAISWHHCVSFEESDCRGRAATPKPD